MENQILVVEENPDDYEKLLKQLNSLGYVPADIIYASSLKEVESIPSSGLKIIIVSISNGRDYDPVMFLNEYYPDVPIIILADNEIEARSSLQNGAQDYLLKEDIDARLLRKSIEYAIERKQRWTGPERANVDYKRYFEESPLPQMIFDENTLEFLAVNNAATQVYGYSEEEFLNKKLTDIRPPEDHDPIIKAINELRHEGYKDTGYWKHLKKNGDLFYVHIFSHPTIYNGRKARFALSIDVDKKLRIENTNRKLNNLINEQKEQLEDVLSSVEEVVWSRNAEDNTLLYINRACEKVYGYTPEEMIGTKGILFDKVHPEDKAKLESAMQMVLKYGNAQTEYRIIHKDGSIRHILGKAVVKTDEKGKPKVVNGICVDATKLRITENALKDKIEEIEEVLANVREVVWVMHADTFELIYTNKACEKVYGYTPEEMMNDKEIFLNAIHPDDRAFFFNQVKVLMETGTVDSDFRIIHKDGSIHYLSGKATLKKGKNGQPDICSGLTVDVTNLKTIQRELKNKAEQLEIVLEGIRDGFFSLDGDFNFTFVNREFEKIYGIPQEELLGVNYWQFFPKSIHQKFYTEYHRALNDQVVVHFEEYASSLDKWVSVSVYPNKHGLTVFFTDITEQRELQERIQRDEYNLRALIDNATDAIWSVDKDLKIISLNNAYRNLICKAAGYMPVEGSNVLWETLPPEFLEKRKQDYYRALNGIRHTIVDQVTFATGTYYRETNFNPIIDANGDIIGVSCFSKDLTETRKYMMKIEKQNKLLREISWIQAHKVRSPIANILGLTQLFNYDDPHDSVNAEVMLTMKQATTDLDQIIKEVVAKTNVIEDTGEV